MHGKDITIPKGTAITAFIQGDDVLDRSKFVRQAQVVAPQAVVPLVPKQQPAAQTAAMDQTYSPETSVADAARENRAKKAQQQDQSQQSQQQGPNN